MLPPLLAASSLIKVTAADYRRLGPCTHSREGGSARRTSAQTRLLASSRSSASRTILPHSSSSNSSKHSSRSFPPVGLPHASTYDGLGTKPRPVFSVPNRKPPRKTKSRLPAHLHQVIRVRDLPMLPAHEAWLLLFRARADFADQFLHSSSRCSMARKLHSTFQPPHCPTLLFVRRLFVHRLRLRHSLLPLLQIGWDLVASPVEASHLRVELPHSIGNLAGA
jgi:hypothetical protein